MDAIIIYYECIIHIINCPLESHHVLNKPHQNSLRTFKDLIIQRDTGTEKATIVYTT